MSGRYFNSVATLLSGSAWYFAVDVSGQYGWLLWIAPLPLLLVAFQSSSKVTFSSAFVAYFIGRCSWIPYLLKVVPVFLVPVFTLLLPLIFALAMLGARRAWLKQNNALAIFAYPLLMTLMEYVSTSLSADGTAASLAYTQSDYLTLIQIASVTGIWGIVFVTALIPSTLAVAWLLKHNHQQSRIALLTGSFIVLAVTLFGWVRLNQQREYTSIKTGMTVVSENLHLFPETPDLQKEKEVAHSYIGQISQLAKQGATVVLFPEKAINASQAQKDTITMLFQKAADRLNISIAGGFTIFKPHAKQNLVLFFSPGGPMQEYKKNFHVNGWEDEFERGNEVGELKGLPVNSGMAICKDMDFPRWLRKYGDADLLFVPAWDFVIDGWLHDRMAVMRGVENGYTIVRAARQGRFTVSDFRGDVIAEANCENGQAVSLLADVPVYSVNTLYSSWGDWFGIVCVIGALLMMLFPLSKK